MGLEDISAGDIPYIWANKYNIEFLILDIIHC
jgi:hypothetical protein